MDLMIMNSSQIILVWYHLVIEWIWNYLLTLLQYYIFTPRKCVASDLKLFWSFTSIVMRMCLWSYSMLASLAKVNVITTLYGEKMLCDLHLFAVDTPPKISNLGSSLDLNSSFVLSVAGAICKWEWLPEDIKLTVREPFGQTSLVRDVVNSLVRKITHR